MGEMPRKRIPRSASEKEIIAYNIHALRVKNFPGHGGASKCAEAYKIEITQWSPWETGRRSPDEARLASIAKFFKVTVDDLKTEPENWPEIRERWLAKKRKRKQPVGTENNPVEQPAQSGYISIPTPEPENYRENEDTQSSVTEEQANKDYVEALQVLLDGQERYGQGKIRPDKYSKVMRSIISLVKYGLAD